MSSVAGIPATPFKATIATDGTNPDEIVLVTGVASLTLTIVRAAELTAGNGASAHNSGSPFAATITTGDYAPTDAAAAMYGYGAFR